MVPNAFSCQVGEGGIEASLHSELINDVYPYKTENGCCYLFTILVAMISSHDNKTQEVPLVDRVPCQLSQEPQKAVPPSEEDDLV